MRLRFSLRFLLVIPVLFAAVLGWLTWPTRTFGTFKKALTSERYEVANSMVHLEDWVPPNGEALECYFESGPSGVMVKCGGGALHRMTDPSEYVDGLIAKAPNIKDVLFSRRVYVDSLYGDPNHQFEFLVQRGTITLRFR